MLTFLAIAAYYYRRKYFISKQQFVSLWQLMMALEERFRAAVRVIQSLPKDGPYQPSNSTKLRFYSLFKQGTEGKCSAGRPSVFNIIGRAKYDAWNKLGDITKDEAMTEYIEELKKIIETMSFSGDVEEFLDSIGPFYEFVSLEGQDMSHIKEALDSWTSSSSSISTNSSNNNSPLKNSNEEDEGSAEGLAAKSTLVHIVNGHAIKSNGHLPNQVVQTEEVTTSAASTSTTYTPPPAPVHRASLSLSRNAAGLMNGFAEHNSDEILEIDEVSHEYQIQNAKRSTAVSVDSLHSGTESDRYFSGESDPEVELEDRFSSSVSVATPGSSHPQLRLTRSNEDVTDTTSPRIRQKINSKQDEMVQVNCGVGMNSVVDARQTPELILHNTLDRLTRDVDHILARVRILEAAYSANGGQINGSNSQLRRKGFFGELSGRSFTLIITWPFIAYFVIKLLKWWFTRRFRRV